MMMIIMLARNQNCDHNLYDVLRNLPWCEEVLFTATGHTSIGSDSTLESDYTIPDFTGVTLVREDTS